MLSRASSSISAWPRGVDISLVYVIICLDCSKGSSKSSTSYRGWILLAVYVCEFALGEGEVAEVAVFTGGAGALVYVSCLSLHLCWQY